MREIVLINITGKDKPGLTASLTKTLAEYNVTILDMGQAVIHDFLSLGILIEIPDQHKSASILKDMLFAAHKLGISRPVHADRRGALRGVGQPAGQGAPHHHPARPQGQRRPDLEGRRRSGRTRPQHRRHHPALGAGLVRRRPHHPHGLHPVQRFRHPQGHGPPARPAAAHLRGNRDRRLLPRRQHIQPHAPAGRLRHGFDPRPGRDHQRPGGGGGGRRAGFRHHRVGHARRNRLQGEPHPAGVPPPGTARKRAREGGGRRCP